MFELQDEHPAEMPQMLVEPEEQQIPMPTRERFEMTDEQLAKAEENR